MKSTARNQLPGRVVAVHPGAVNDTVEVQLGGGEHLVAVVTHESTQALGLAAGRDVVALVKAPWVVLLTEDQGMRFSARNHFRGTIQAVKAGAVNAEVVLKLTGGTELVAIVTQESAQALGLRAGLAASALIKASHVILGVAEP